MFLRGIKHLRKISSRNTRKTFKICSKLTIKTQSDVIDVVLVLLLLTLNLFQTFFSVSFVDFEQVNVSWFEDAERGSLLFPYRVDFPAFP